MADANVGLTIPSKLIEDVVRAEIMRSLAEQKTTLIDGVIKSAMSEKASSYGQETKWEAMVKDAIRAEAVEIWREFIDEHRAAIRDAIYKHLTKNKSRALREIAEQMCNGISRYSASVSFTFKEGDDA